MAPGGFRLLLGLPCGVDTGVMKLFLAGVLGESTTNGSFGLDRVWRGGGGTGRIPSCLLLDADEGKRLAIKLDMV